MLALSFEFVTGRYHATEWGKNVNDGIVDWPPSIWRILRAIISAWHIKLHEEITKDEIESLLNELVCNEASFYLPNATRGHTRHYMPFKEKTTKIIDSFISIDPNDLVVVRWDKINLNSEQKETVDRVADAIQYLGRAESWCIVRRMKENIPQPNCSPSTKDADSKGKLTKVLVPDSATLEQLCKKTQDLHKECRINPLGSKWMQYLLESEERMQRPNILERPINVLRYRIAGNVKPKITETIKIASSIRRTAMSKYGKDNNNDTTPMFSGKDRDGKHLQDNHNHAFFLPTDEDEDNMLDHMTIVAANSPFNQKEMSALKRIRYAWNGQNRLDIIFQGRGSLDEFDKIPILQKSKKWISVTPYVMNRHMKIKKKGDATYIVDGPKDQLRKEIQNRFGDITIKKMTVQDSKSKMSKNNLMPIQFTRWRKDKLSGFGAYNVSIEFDQILHGPLSLGHGAHFGLGMFVPDQS